MAWWIGRPLKKGVTVVWEKPESITRRHSMGIAACLEARGEEPNRLGMSV